MEADHRIEFSSASKALHWLIALLVLVELVLGQWMSEPEGRELRRTLLRLHQSNGLLIGALVVIRLAWRLYAVLPEWPTSITPQQRKLLYSIEAVLYLGLLAMPLAGLGYAMLDDQTIAFFGWPPCCRVFWSSAPRKGTCSASTGRPATSSGDAPSPSRWIPWPLTSAPCTQAATVARPARHGG